MKKGHKTKQAPEAPSDLPPGYDVSTSCGRVYKNRVERPLREGANKSKTSGPREFCTETGVKGASSAALLTKKGYISFTTSSLRNKKQPCLQICRTGIGIPTEQEPEGFNCTCLGRKINTELSRRKT
jgi:hypothetical protein